MYKRDMLSHFSFFKFLKYMTYKLMERSVLVVILVSDSILHNNYENMHGCSRFIPFFRGEVGRSTCGCSHCKAHRWNEYTIGASAGQRGNELNIIHFQPLPSVFAIYKSKFGDKYFNLIWALSLFSAKKNDISTKYPFICMKSNL